MNKSYHSRQAANPFPPTIHHAPRATVAQTEPATCEGCKRRDKLNSLLAAELDRLHRLAADRRAV
jgi:hypothetical protein